MAREERNIIGYTVGLISEFAKHYGIHTRQAYGVLHTQSFADTVDVLTQVCLNNGGQLR